MKLLIRLILLLVTFYNPAFADVIKSDDDTGLITLTHKDAVYAIENGIVLSSEPDASIRGKFSFVLLFNKQVWDCDYILAGDPGGQSWFMCMSQNKFKIRTTTN